jgi:hypothetical protein
MSVVLNQLSKEATDAAYHLGSPAFAKYVQRIIDLEAQVKNLERMIFEMKAATVTAREKRPSHLASMEAR